MAKFTLLELHLDGAEFTANAPFSSDDDESASESRWSRAGTDESGDETDGAAGGGPSVGRLALVLLGVVVVVAVVLRLYLGGSDADDDSDGDL